MRGRVLAVKRWEGVRVRRAPLSRALTPPWPVTSLCPPIPGILTSPVAARSARAGASAAGGCAAERRDGGSGVVSCCAGTRRRGGSDGLRAGAGVDRQAASPPPRQRGDGRAGMMERVRKKKTSSRSFHSDAHTNWFRVFRLVSPCLPFPRCRLSRCVPPSGRLFEDVDSARAA